MNSIAGVCMCHGLAVPVRTMIRDKRVVRMHNCLRCSVLLISIVLFFFFQRGFVVPTDVLIAPNAWIGNINTSITNIPTYCDNPNFDFEYDKNFIVGLSVS